MFLHFMTGLYFVKLWWDDWFLLFTMLLYTGYCSMVIAMELIAFKKSSASAPLITIVTNVSFRTHQDVFISLKFQLLLAAESVYLLGMVTLKISLGLFFYRLLSTRKQRQILMGVVTLSTVMGISYFFWGLFQCGTPGVGDTFWFKRLTNRCKHEPQGAIWGYIHSGINTITDIILSTLPIPLVWKAKINKKDKIVVSAILILANWLVFKYSSASRTVANPILARALSHLFDLDTYIPLEIQASTSSTISTQ